MRRVVVTGIGVVSAIGNDKDTFWESLKAGRSGMRQLGTEYGEPIPVPIVADSLDFDPTPWVSENRIGLMDRFAIMGVAAAKQAIVDAGLQVTPENAPRIATIMGNGGGGYVVLDESYKRFYYEGKPRIHPLMIPKAMPNALSSGIAMELGFKGPNYTVSTACASSNHAIGQAYWTIRNGQADAAMTGGFEALLAHGVLKAWAAMRVVGRDVCRPFAKTRTGMILGEGGGAYLLEEFEAARARGATIYGEIVGFGMSADAKDLVAPDADGCARAMQSALDDGGLAPEQVQYINAHGTGTLANDVTETRAIRQVFGAHADRLAVSSTKSMHGHALGGAGGIEFAASLMALTQGVLPPTISLDEPDPECDLDYVPHTARNAEVDVAVSNAFAFGGLNAVVATRRVDT